MEMRLSDQSEGVVAQLPVAEGDQVLHHGPGGRAQEVPVLP